MSQLLTGVGIGFLFAMVLVLWTMRKHGTVEKNGLLLFCVGVVLVVIAIGKALIFLPPA